MVKVIIFLLALNTSLFATKKILHKQLKDDINLCGNNMNKYSYSFCSACSHLTLLVTLLSLSLIFTLPKFALAQSETYTYDVEHLFTHCLIAHPEIATSGNSATKKHILADCITTKEFESILHSLHKNNYVLVNINNCFSVNNGVAQKTKVKVPYGKKALILSFDDVVYDSKKQQSGMVDKIILDQNGNLATETLINGKKVVSYNNEFITLLENFIKKNPTFSPYGARGTINLTGFDGILGYRTSHTNAVNRSKEIEKAQQVVNKLKKLGWTFASHSYGHYHMNKISNEKFKQELNLWKDEVEPLVGKTQIYVYPYGEWQVFENGELCTKHKLLNEYGFYLFCGVGMKSFYAYLPTKSQNKVLFMDRKCLDGNTLTKNHTELQRFFNPLDVLDKIRLTAS